MQPSAHSPLPPEYRTRANTMTALLGIGAFAVSAFFIGAIRNGAPLPSIAILLLIMGFAAAAGLLSVWQSNNYELDAREIRYRLRAGAHAGVRTAFAVAALIVLATALFASTGAAIAAVVPALLSILPAAFVAMLIAALAAGVRLPNLGRPSSALAGREIQLSKATVVLVALCVGGFLVVFALPKANEPENSTTGSPSFRDAGIHNQSAYSGRRDVTTTERAPFPPEPPREVPASPPPVPQDTNLFRNPPGLSYSPSEPQTFRTPDIPSQPTGPRTLSENEPMYQTVWTFVVNHHKKINRGTPEMVITDYADQVNYFEHGTVDRSYIYRDELASRARFNGWSEVIMQPVVVEELEPGHYEASYQIVYDANKRNGQHVTGASQVYLFLKQFPEGLKIVSQQSRLESGE